VPNNVLLTPQILVRLILMNLGGYLAVARNMTKQYASEFAKPGAKVGDTVSVRKPQRFVPSVGLLYQPQALSNVKTTITVNDVTGVHYEWDSVEKTLSLQDANEMYGKPAAIAMAHNVNARAAQFAAQNTFNAVGTPGTTPTLLDTYLSAGDKIVELGLPPEELLTCIVNRKMSSQFVVGQKTLFNPAGAIGGTIKDGGIAEGVDNLLGYKWVRDQTIYTQLGGAQGGTPQVSGAGQGTSNGNNDTMSLNVKNLSSTVWNVGDRFTIAGIYSVHPQTRQSTGDLQQFVVLAPFSAASTGSVTIAPGITPSGQYQNVTASPADATAITLLGAASFSSPQGLLMHKNSYAFVSIPLDTPKGPGVISSHEEEDPETGLRASFVSFFDGVHRVEGNRLDMLDGFGVLYREMCCVIAS